ncbi:unnamed protein product [Clonostachys rosea]|uniref:Uncharacterized protein n=1 Tax=Bionectria ochroleuca TaxID=29856 RepID=A0ABY6UMJ7_BIOOC|nr:unnamed protein product [Clonostachys rosea]
MHSVKVDARQPSYPVVTRDTSLLPEEVQALTTGEFRVHRSEDVARGSPTANARDAMSEWYPDLGRALLSWSTHHGALIQREAEAEPIIFPMEQGLYAVAHNRIGVAFALLGGSESAGHAIARGMARRAAIREGLTLANEDKAPKVRWMVRTRLDAESVLEQPVSLRSGEFVVLSPGQQLFQLDLDANVSAIWTEHQLYADPTPREEPAGEPAGEDVAEEALAG